VENDLNKRYLGDDYEKIAAIYLRAEGYEVIQQNFQCKMGEIDIIAQKEGYLRFIEVKYRSNAITGLPQEAVTYQKQRKICKTATYYMMKNNYSMDTPCCFDVVAILGNEIKLYENAFEYWN